MENVVLQKSFSFAVRIVNACRYLNREHREFVMSRQLLKSGTSIGANTVEAQQAQSRADFIAKLSIALKESFETAYWIRLLAATEYLTERQASSLLSECIELQRLLTSIIKTSRE